MNDRFREELKSLINTHSMEQGSNTPDAVLAGYLCDCLDAFDNAVKAGTDLLYPDPHVE